MCSGDMGDVVGVTGWLLLKDWSQLGIWYKCGWRANGNGSVFAAAEEGRDEEGDEC